MVRSRFILALALAIPITASADPGSFYLHNGDRVVFYGDSITEQHLYTNDIETYVATRFPKLNVLFWNSGVGGDRVSGGWAGAIDLRIKRDILPFRPNIMTCMLGMNDAGYRPFDQSLFNSYTTGYQHLLTTVKNDLPNIQYTLIQPSPYDDVNYPLNFPGGYNAVLIKYADEVKVLAKQYNALCSNFNGPMVAMLEKAKSIDPTLASQIIPGRIHPSPAGHLIMAEQLLETWNAPALVASVRINADTGTIHTENSTVSNYKDTAGVISWTETDGSLPYPLDLKDKVTQLVLKSSDFVEKLDQEPLTVSGLTATSYTLSIDGKSVGTFTSMDLASGVNLATIETPMLDQAETVQGLTDTHNNVRTIAWRNLQIPLQNDTTVAGPLNNSLKSLNKLDESLQAERSQKATPVQHTFTLTPA